MNRGQRSKSPTGQQIDVCVWCSSSFRLMWCSSVILLQQGVAGDDMPPRQPVETARREERGHRDHLHAHLPSGCGVHVGLRPYRCSTQRGVRRLQC